MNKDKLRTDVELMFDGVAPCDTDKLVDDIRALLTKYGHENSEHGVCTLLNTYFKDKKDLICLLRKHPAYLGDMRIAVDIDMPRELSRNYIKNVLDGVFRSAENRILSKIDDNGNSFLDYIHMPKKTVSAFDLKDENGQFVSNIDFKALENFSVTGFTKTSISRFNDFSTDLRTVSANIPFVTNDSLSVIAKSKDMHLHANEKTTRAVRKVCEYYGVTTKNDADGKTIPNKEFETAYAKYADAVATNARHMIMYISVNPLDYLTMSFGNSWASCHTIDKKNKRDMPNSYQGMYCGGTLSYMLDRVSLITFLHDSAPDDIVDAGKIYRCMFHFYELKHVMVQGRVYPQGSGGATDLYKVIRTKMQSVLSVCMGVPNEWTKSSQKPSDYAGLSSVGVHYRDYTCFPNCNISYLTGNDYILDDRDDFVIGHTGVCVYCGNEIDDNGALAHEDCEVDDGETETYELTREQNDFVFMAA